MWPARRALAGLTILVGVAAPAAPPDPTDPWAVVIDTRIVAASSAAPRDLLGANRPPRFEGRMAPFHRYDASALYRAFGVTSVRLHDAGVDLCEIYRDATVTDRRAVPPRRLTQCVNTPVNPPPLVEWRVNDPARIDEAASYDFTAVDATLASIAALPARVYLRLGESFNGPNDTPDAEAWSRVARNIHRHVIGRFAADALPAIDVHAVEIHNEPDGFFWQGSAATFFDLVRRTADTVRSDARAADREHPAGGPGFTQNVTRGLAQPGSLTAQFLASVRANRLDFFSAHFYGNCAATTLADLRDWLRSLRRQIDAQGFTGRPLHVSEWNIGLGQQCGNALYRQPRLASFTAAALALMGEAEFEVTAAHFYAGVPIMGLFSAVEGQPRFEVQPAAWAFWAHRALHGGQALAVRHCANGVCAALADRTEGPVVAAARSGDRIFAVLANDAALARTLRVRIFGLAEGESTAWLWRAPTDRVHALDGSINADGRVEPTRASIRALFASVTPETGELASVPGSEARDLVVGLGPYAIALVRIEQPRQPCPASVTVAPPGTRTAPPGCVR